jgi:hypothetical protein
MCRGCENAPQMLLCGDGKGKGCDKGFHMFCLVPPVKAPPESDWFCDNCTEQGGAEHRKVGGAGTGAGEQGPSASRAGRKRKQTPRYEAGPASRKAKSSIDV